MHTTCMIRSTTEKNYVHCISERKRVLQSDDAVKDVEIARWLDLQPPNQSYTHIPYNIPY